MGCADVMTTRTRTIALWAVLFCFFPLIIIGSFPLMIPAPWSSEFRFYVRLATGVAPFLAVLTGLLLGLCGFLPGTRKLVKIRVRTFLESGEEYEPVDAIRAGSGIYRIFPVGAKPGKVIWEFSHGDTVRCIEASMPDGTKALVAVERINRII